MAAPWRAAGTITPTVSVDLVSEGGTGGGPPRPRGLVDDDMLGRRPVLRTACGSGTSGNSRRITVAASSKISRELR